VIIEGGSYSAGWWWARHVKNVENNERIEVMEVEGLDGDSIEGFFRQMYAVSKATNCKNYFEQWNINLPKHESLPDEQWQDAHAVTRKNHGLEGQPFFRVRHTKRDEDGNLHVHEHCFTLRIDIERMKAISDSLSARTREQTARELETKYGLTPVQSVLVPNREGPRPERLAKKYERFRGEKCGIDPHDIDKELRAIKTSCDNGQSFKAAIEADHRYLLAQGDRRDFLVIDQAAKEHSLARRLGIKKAELQKFMGDVDRGSLPTVAQGRLRQLERAAAREFRDKQRDGIGTVEPRPSNMRTDGRAETAPKAQEREKLGGAADAPVKARTLSDDHARGPQPEIRPLGKTAGEIRLAWRLTDTGQQFAQEIEKRGLALVYVSAEEAAASQRARDFAKAMNRQGRALKEGFAVVDSRGTVTRIDQRVTGDQGEEITKRLGGIDRAELLTVANARAMMKEANRAAFREQKDAERREQARLSTPQGKTPQDIRAAWNENLPRHPDAGKDAEQLAEALAARGAMAMARATAEEAYQSERAAALAKAAGAYAPVFKEGEIVIINAAGNVYRLDERTTGSERSAIDQRLAGIDAGDLLSVADTKEAMREASRAAWAEQQEKARPASWIETRILDCEQQARISGAVIQQDKDGVAVSGLKALAEQIETETATIHGPEAFAALLDQAGIAVVRVTASDEIALVALRQDAELAATVAHAEGSTMRRGGMLADVKAGDLAAVDRAGNVYRLNPYKLDLEGLEARLIDAANPASSTSSSTPTPTSSRLMSVTEARASFEIERRQIDEFWTQRRAEATGERVTVFEERAADAEVRNIVSQAERGAMVPFAEGAKVIDKMTGAAQRLAEGIIKSFEGIISALDGVLSTPSKPTELQAEVAPKVAAEKQQEAADSADHAERAERLDALLSQIARQDAERRLRRELGTELDDDRGREREL
jgi:hypothetical protein